ncbi:MAG: Uma2 family endonuclease, partial [Saprospiraceae bacterium]
MSETIASILPDYETERQKPMPSLNHSIVQANLITELNVRYKKKFRVASEHSLELSDWPTVPDLSICSKKPLDLNNDVIRVTEPPLGVVEIISPSQSLDALVHKATDYFAHGVKSCWLVLLPLANIYVFTGPGRYEIFRDQEILKDAALGIELPLGDIFS